MNEPKPGQLYEMTEEVYDEEIKTNMGQRILAVLRNFVLLLIALPILNLAIIFVFCDWLLGGRNYQKLLNYVDDFVDQKINYVLKGVQENESFIVLQPELDDDEDY